MKRTTVRVLLLLILQLTFSRAVFAGGDEAQPVFAGKPASFWVERLKKLSFEHEPTWGVKQLAAGGEAALPVLLHAIRTPDPRVPGNALQAMRLMGEKAKSGVPVLVGKLRDRKSLTFARTPDVIRTLLVIAREPEKLVPDIRRALASEFSWDRLAAAEALTDLGHADKKVISVFIEELPWSASPVTVMVCRYLAKIGPAAKKAIPKLKTVLGRTELGKDWSMHHAAVRALMGIGDPSVRLLQDLIITSIPEVQIEIAGWFGARGERSAKSAGKILKALEDEDNAVRAAVAECLGRIGPKASSTARGLYEALEDVDDGVRVHAAHALAKMGPTGFRKLVDGIRSEDPLLMESAAIGFASLGPDAASAAPDLVAAFAVGVATDELAAALEAIGEAAVAPLAEGLTHESVRVRKGCARTLGLIGPAAKAAVPALMAMSGDEDWHVRQAAKEALGKIRGE